jgi:hypothetical protein
VDQGVEVLVSDLAGEAGRWPLFVPAAIAAGVADLFSRFTS